jgi:hypothetical protein
MISFEDAAELAIAALHTDDPEIKFAFEEFRDRLPYTYLTGSSPTHLRTPHQRLWRSATRLGKYSPEGKVFIVKPEIVVLYDLEQHPMVRKAKEYLKDGYGIAKPRDSTERRPYGEIKMCGRLGPMSRRRITVKLDGSVREGWDKPPRTRRPMNPFRDMRPSP